ncbi:vitamin K epoxide reductase family protein [Candidatus Saccharibacteria bacterium TM7i]|nr:vitamin K epoxide reductase family protein [Candidatus Saccharibacteria bacterium TM7i]
MTAFGALFKKKDSKTEERSIRTSFIVLFIGAVLALIAAFVLSLEEIHLLKNPDAVLSCSFNLVLNCATVMQTWQASVFFGIPNMFIGLMAFPVLVAVAVAAIWGGAIYRRWFLLALNIGVLLGTIFAYWLFFNSVYVIQVLCPWCLVVTFSCTLMLAAVTHITLRQNLLGFGKKTNEKVQNFLKSGYHQLIVATWIVLMIALVFVQFGADLFA